MPTKQEWLEYLKLCKAYSKAYAKYVIALEKWVKSQKSGEVSTADSGGSNPPTDPPKPPGIP